MGEPSPALSGASNATEMVVLPFVATGLRGTPGVLSGITVFETFDISETPAAFSAVIENV